MDDNRSAQAVIAPFAVLLTAFLWLETWLEILSRGSYHSPDDLSKLYLGVMGAYAGAAEISKWLVKEPTDPAADPMFERIHRGGVFIGLWLAPLLFAYGWRITNPAVPMPEPLQKITAGLVAIFFLKAASRRWRHQKHGVMNPDAGAGPDGEDVPTGAADASEAVFAETLFRRISASPEGLRVAEMIAAFPGISRPTIFRSLRALLKTKRVRRTGKPRTPDVRYRAE